MKTEIFVHTDYFAGFCAGAKLATILVLGGIVGYRYFTENYKIVEKTEEEKAQE